MYTCDATICAAGICTIWALHSSARHLFATCSFHTRLLLTILTVESSPPPTVRPPALFTPVHTRAACVCTAVNSARAPTAGEKLLPTAWSCVLCPMKHETHIFSAPGFHGSLQLSTSHVPSVLPDLLCKSSEGSIKAQNYLCNDISKFSFVPHETRNLHVQFP